MIDAAMVMALLSARSSLGNNGDLQKQIEDTIANVLTAISKTAQNEAVLQDQKAKDLAQYNS